MKGSHSCHLSLWLCKFSTLLHNSGTIVNFAQIILHLRGFIAPLKPVSLLHQRGRGSGKARPSEAHLLREEQPEQRGGGPRANGEAVPPHRPQVITWERLRRTEATSEDALSGDRVRASRLPPVSETVWRELLQDLLDMQQNVYACLKPEACHQVSWIIKQNPAAEPTVVPFMMTLGEKWYVCGCEGDWHRSSTLKRVFVFLHLLSTQSRFISHHASVSHMTCLANHCLSGGCPSRVRMQPQNELHRTWHCDVPLRKNSADFLAFIIFSNNPEAKYVFYCKLCLSSQSSFQLFQWHHIFFSSSYVEKGFSVV